MILHCYKCNAEIDKKNVNIGEGVAHCTNCNEYFRIADYLRDDEEIRRIKKPFFSKVNLVKEFDQTVIQIPSQGWTGTAWFFLFFTTFWNLISWFTFIKSITGKGDFTWSAVPFLLIGFATFLLFLFIIKGKTTLQINKADLFVKWELFGYKIKRSRRTSDLEKVTEDIVYQQNYQPVYGIGLYFKTERKIKFGSGLLEEERKWLVGELNELKKQYVIKPTRIISTNRRR